MQSQESFVCDNQQIYFTASSLSGTATQWFSNYLIQTPLPRVVTHWDTFIQEFNAMFGNRNCVEMRVSVRRGVICSPRIGQLPKSLAVSQYAVCSLQFASRNVASRKSQLQKMDAKSKLNIAVSMLM